VRVVSILGAVVGICAALIALFRADDGVAETAIIVVLVILAGQLATRLYAAVRGR